MKVLGNSETARLAVIGSQHGNEPFGRDVIKRLASDFEEDSGLLLIIANEKALEQNVRYIDEDLNRAYGKEPGSSHEATVAHEIKETIKHVPLVLDLHTATMEVDSFPIIVRYRAEEQRLLSFTDYTEVIYMDLDHGGGNSGLGSCEGGGLALEFSSTYVEKSFEAAYAQVRTLIEKVLNDAPPLPIKRKIYHVTKTAPWISPEELSLHDFEYSPRLGGYAILPNVPEYAGLYRGFVATELIDTVI